MVRPTPAPHAGSARLFIGLWPDEAVRAALAAHQQRWQWPRGASPVARERLHLTLHFLGDVGRGGVPALVAALEGVRAAPFTLRCERPRRWHGGLAVLEAAPGEGLPALHRALGEALEALQVRLERRADVPGSGVNRLLCGKARRA